MIIRHPFIRNLDAEDYFDNFLISAVSAIVAIRFYLELTGYPQIGGGGLHIAHMLWGGFLMLAAILMMLFFLNKAVFSLAATLGGLGFGAFIDELGKFITQDHNYFFQPTFAFIYMIFILLYFVFRFIERKQIPSQQEYLINSLESVKEAILNELGVEERKRVLKLLSMCDTNDQKVKALSQMLYQINAIPLPPAGRLVKIKLFFQNLYFKLLQNRWFIRFIVLLFIIQAIIAPSQILDLIDKIWRSLITLEIPGLTIIEWGNLIFSVIAGSLTLIGIFKIRNSRLFAYQMFKRSILVVILSSQIFAFYTAQLAAIWWFFINILLFFTLDYMIKREQAMLN